MDSFGKNFIGLKNSARPLRWIRKFIFIFLASHFSLISHAQGNPNQFQEQWVQTQKSKGLEIWKTKTSPRIYCSVVLSEERRRYLTSLPSPDDMKDVELEKNRALSLFGISNRVILKEEFRKDQDGRKLFVFGNYVNSHQEKLNFVEIHRNLQSNSEFLLCSSLRALSEKKIDEFYRQRGSQ